MKRCVIAVVLAGVPCLADDLLVPSQYPTIQDAITAAKPGDHVVLADGVYKGKFNVNVRFLGKAITVRSANGPAACVIDMGHAAGTSGFIFDQGEGPGSVLLGITIRAGNSGAGGGVSIINAAPTIERCVFAENWNGLWGGGAHLKGAKGVTFRDCVFDQNLSGFGGGAYLESSMATFERCTFTKNRVDLFGGAGIYAITGSVLAVRSCRFVENNAVQAFSGNGVGVLVQTGEATILNSLFDSNAGNGFGGAVSAAADANVTIVNCSFLHNSNFSGGALYNGANSTTIVTSCLFFNHTPDEFSFDKAEPIIRYSRTDLPVGGPGNFTHDPMLVGPFSGDYRPMPGSPLIDAGDTPALPGTITTDLNLEPRRVDDPATPDTGVGPPPVVDIGAFEFQADSCYADCDGSGSLDLFDFLCFTNAFNAGDPYADCDGSGSLDLFDFLCFANEFNAGCP
jgi:hypothetical protein